MSVKTGEGHKPCITLNKLKHIIVKHFPESSPITTAEDPCDNLFSESFSFYGGEYIIFPGIVENCSFILKTITVALFKYMQTQDEELLENLYANIIFILTLSDNIAKRLGISRNVKPQDIPLKPIYFPAQNDLNDLATAVTFNRNDINNIIEEINIKSFTFEHFISSNETLELDKFQIINSVLHEKPLIRCNGDIIVSLPGMLLAALRHYIVKEIINNDLVSEFAEAYKASTWSEIVLGFKMMRITEEQSDLMNDVSKPYLKEGIFRFDLDKIMYVQVLLDDLNNYNYSEVFGDWDQSNVDMKLVDRARSVMNRIYETYTDVNMIISIFIYQGTGRAPRYPIEDYSIFEMEYALLLSAGDLQTIAILESENRLFLYKYVKALSRLFSRIKQIVSSPLDLLNIYINYNFSFYMSDEKLPDAIYNSPGGAGEVRFKAVSKLDMHAAPHYDNRSYVDVFSFNENPNIPIYVPIHDVSGMPCFIVNNLPISIWVTCGTNYAKGDPEIFSFYINIIQSVAYWIWQISPFLKQILSQIESLRFIQIEISFPHAVFDSLKSRNPIERDDIKQNAIEYRLVNPRKLAIILSPTLVSDCYGPNNKYERELILVLLNSIIALLKHNTNSNYEYNFNDILDDFAPLGMKKHIIMFKKTDNPLIDSTNTPKLRFRDDADKSIILDDIGEYILGLEQYKVNDSLDDRDRQVHLLENIVSFLYVRFRKLILSLKGDGLIEYLIAQNESGIAKRYYDDQVIPCKIACYKGVEDVYNSIKDERIKADQTNLAIRFMIEFISAEPANGLRQLSLSVYDELLALATEIINWAYDRDLIEYEITKANITLLPSRRVDVAIDEFLKARSQFHTEHMSEEITKIMELYPELWKQADSIRENDEDTIEYEKAFKAEFKVEFELYLDFIFTIFNQGIKQDSPSGKLSEKSIIKLMSDNLNIDKGVTQYLLDLYSLKPRKDFLDPPVGFKRTDIYPWRFNRRLSHHRKPMIQVKEDNEAFYYWGNRNLFHSIHYLRNLILNGKIERHSAQMKSFIAKRLHFIGESFNQRVARKVKLPELKTKIKLNKIGGIHLSDPLGTIGDIDVMVIHPKMKKVLLLESKAISLARNPYEIKREIEKIFKSKRKKSSTIGKIKRREDWFKANLKAIQDHYGLQSRGKWVIESAIIFDQVRFSAHLYECDIPFLSFKIFSEVYFPEWYSRKKSLAKIK